MTAAIEDRIKTLTQATATFDSGSVTRGDYKVMDKGGAAPYCVLRPGPFESEERGGWALVKTVWTKYADIIASFQDDDYSQLMVAVEGFVNNINVYPTLNNLTGVVRTLAKRGEELTYIYPKGSSEHPQFVMQTIEVEVEEHKSYDGSGEFA